MRIVVFVLVLICAGQQCFSQDIQELVVPIVISGSLSEIDRYETSLMYSSTGAPESIGITGFEDDGGKIGICLFGGPVGQTTIGNATFAGRPGGFALTWLCPFGGSGNVELGWMKLTVTGGGESKFFAELRHMDRATQNLVNLVTVPAVVPALDWQVMLGINTGLVIVNPNSLPVQITINNQHHKEPCEISLTLQPMGRISKFMSELESTCDFRGSARITGDLPIAAATVNVDFPKYGFHFYGLPSHVLSDQER